jgi:hypothetical protein
MPWVAVVDVTEIIVLMLFLAIPFYIYESLHSKCDRDKTELG